MGKLANLIGRFPFLWEQFLRFLKENKYRYKYKEKSHVKINIVSPNTGWILNKFADCVCNELVKLGYDAVNSTEFDSSSDINHYFVPNNIGYSRLSKVDSHTSFMITHVDTALKLNQIKELTNKGAIGICMSKETKNRLIANGVRADRICYINPAQDGQIEPRKVVLGFTHRVYNDSRKRDDIILDVCKEIDPEVFSFKIMGDGWDSIVTKMKEMGFEVEYHPVFDKVKYNELILSLDYYCYFGFDEGSMGFLDAMAAGIGTIVTPQGYHLDTEVEITYPVETLSDIVNALKSIENKRHKYINFAKNWTWEAYTKKHIEIWKYMLGCEKLDVLLKNRGLYMDGIFSLLIEDLSYHEPLVSKIKKLD